MKLPFYWVDAFTDRPFSGNPAAVCPLEHWPGDRLLQDMARQHGLSETAYLVPSGQERYALRWFTPAVEIPLCGHATLASAHVLFAEKNFSSPRVEFESKSGILSVSRESDGKLTMDFPCFDTIPIEVPKEIAVGLGAWPIFVGKADSMWLCVFSTAAEVRRLQPDFAALSAIAPGKFIATAPGDAPGIDFVSRFFAPAAGIPEDPVTGSAHCALTPYWASRLGRTALRARQESARGGDLWCRLAGDRVEISGRAVTYLRGAIDLPD